MPLRLCAWAVAGSLPRLFGNWLSKGRRTHFIPDAIDRALLFMWVRSTVQYLVFGRMARFNVTRKAITTDSYNFNWPLLRWILIPIALLTVGLIYAFVDPASPPRLDGDWAASLGLSAYFLAMWVAAALACIEAPQRRVDDRYGTDEMVEVRDGSSVRRWRCIDIGVGGTLLATDGVTAPAELELALEGVGPVHAKLVRRVGKNQVAYAFHSPEQRPALIRKIYCSDRYISLPDGWSFTQAAGAFLQSLIPRQLRS